MKHKTYIPLHGHSTYSIGDSVVKIEDLIKKVKEIGANAVGLTEHGNMASFLKFYKLAKKEKIKPIIGCELYLNDFYFSDKEKFLELNKSKKSSNEDEEDWEDNLTKDDAASSHFLAYAKNYEGLKNLLSLSNNGFLNFYRKPLINSEMILQKLDNNNIVTTGCMNSIFNKLILKKEFDTAAQLIKQYKEKFGKDFYFEIQLNSSKEQSIINNFYYKISKITKIKPVFSLDYHYINKDDWYLQYLLYVIKSRKTVASYPVENWFYDIRDLYLKDVSEVYNLAEQNGLNIDFLNTAIESTFEIADKVDIDIPFYSDKLPKYHDDYSDSVKTFKNKLVEKWNEKVKFGLIPNDKIEIYKQRLKYESEIMIEKKIIDYFLILDDILNGFVISQNGALGSGRGSAGSSLVLFVLDITKIDPIKHELIFERFINPSRIDAPDIDCDIDSITHPHVEDYIKSKYGIDKVCHIGNYGRFSSKVIIKDLCRIFELNFLLSNKLTSLFSNLGNLSIEDEIENAIKISKKMNDSDLLDFIETNKEIFTSFGSKMVGMIRHIGRHASGILISNRALESSELPIIKTGGEIITAVQEGGDDREITELGYLKLDILGLSTATVLNQTFKMIENKYNKFNIEKELINSELDDIKVYKQFHKGNTRDIFQFGSDSMVDLIKKVKPNSIYDLSAINGLFRPALIQSGGIDEYLKNRKNLENAKKDCDNVHPELWNIVKDTCGVIIFQEQMMFVFQKLGGFTMAEADKMRKIMKLLHKGNQNENQDFMKMLDKFRNSAMANGISKENVEILLNKLAKYSEYLFNKSHSLSYSINAYISMWLKVYYPKEYFTALLNNSTQEDISWFMKHAKELKIKFNDFVCNKCDVDFAVDYKANSLKIGLKIMKGAALNDLELFTKVNIKNLNELIEFVRSNKISKKTVEPLCRLNYFKDIYKNSAALEMILIEAKKIKKKDATNDIQIVIKAAEKIKEYTKSETFKFQKEYLNFYLDEHPFERFHDAILEKASQFFDTAKSPKELDESMQDGDVTVFGIINDIIMKKTKKTNKEYYKILLEDDEKQIYMTLWNPKDILGFNIGDFIIADVTKGFFGFAKTRGTKIQKIEDR